MMYMMERILPDERQNNCEKDEIKMKSKNESIYTNHLLFRDMVAHSKIITAILLCLVIFASILVLTLPEEYSFVGMNNPVVGQEAPKTVYATMEFSVPDTAKEKAMRQEQLNALPLYYFRDDAANEKLKNGFQFFINEVGRRYKVDQNIAKEKVYDVLADHNEWQQKLVQQIRGLTAAQNRYLYQKFFASNENLNIYLQTVYPRLDSGLMNAEMRDKIDQSRNVSIVFDGVNEMAPKKAGEIFTPNILADILTGEALQYYGASGDFSVFRENLQRIFVYLLDQGNVVYSPEAALYNEQKQKQAEQEFNKKLK